VNKVLSLYQLPGSEIHQERITGMAWAGNALWYARGDANRIGRFSPADGAWREWAIVAPRGRNLILGEVHAMRTPRGAAANVVVGCGSSSQGFIHVQENPLQASLCELGEPSLKSRFDAQIQGGVFGVAPDNATWMGALVRPKGSTGGFAPSIARFRRDGAGVVVVTLWQLPRHAAPVRAFWFDSRKRPWAAFGQGNFLIPSGYMCGVLLTPSNDMACYECPELPLHDYESLTGHDGTTSVYCNRPGTAFYRDAALQSPFVSPGGPRLLDVFEYSGRRSFIAADEQGDVWFSEPDSSPARIGRLQHTSTPQRSILATVMHERLATSRNPGTITTLKMRPFAQGTATPNRSALSGTPDASGNSETWPLIQDARFITPRSDVVWFAMTRECRIAALT